jgi:hypothetical protein
MKEDFLEDEYSEMWIENGIGFQVYKPNLEITIDVARKMVEKRISSFNGISRPVLVDIRNLASVDRESMKYFATREAGELIRAGAIYMNNPITRWFGNIFLTLDQPITPARLFTNKAKALNWLEKYKNLN